ncbi:MAG: bifunctional phosphopantothenoylcysteine decarboxylase/phosphopantothenate--cysteine ligase CoaBC [Wenzhouxiangellaceae bacterium]|nr:bifunctional phosphopantothenoylcysteine decarboxylase/phosphopantothenate--cysteine ligase CoaBC [Wenzhouxiangellaceae bacterium]
MTHPPQTQDDRARPASRRVVVGVSGGIAAYKAPELVRRLRERNCEVRVVLTRAAREFVAPLSLQAVSGHRVHDRLLDEDAESGMGHIELARWADDIVIAPATADLVARLAAGMADDLLTTLVLATEARIWLAPAMNRVMWDHPSVQDNLARLAERGARMLGPDSGSQACGEIGYGRMLAPEEIAERVARVDTGALEGKRFVVTAGPTHEALDPVRFLGNRSSGRMGFAVAEALREAGAAVVLVAGPVRLPTPGGVERVDVVSAEQMHEAVFAALPADGFVGVAAVADYRPADPRDRKIRKTGEPMTLELLPNPDILRDVAASSPRPFVVGFAAETEDLAERARGKLADKNLDLIAANRVGDGLGFDTSDNELEVFAAHDRWTLGRGPKPALARELVAIIAGRMTNDGDADRRKERDDA